MTGCVHVVVDDSACITPQQAEQFGITVVPLPVATDEDEPKTSAIQPLPLCAAYARAQERAQDAGVVAIHIGSALSSTYNNAVAAAEAVDGVEVIDSHSVGAALGVAAIAAARVARQGADRNRCAEEARQVLQRSSLWGYVPKLDTMRRGGRISTSQVMLSTALAMKPMIGLTDGQLRIAAKCRTEQKLLETIVRHCVDDAAGYPVECVLQRAGESSVADLLATQLPEVLPKTSVLREVDLPPALIVHTGAAACFVAVVASPEVKNTSEDPGSVDGRIAGSADAAGVTDPAGPGSAAGVTTIGAQLPTWSENRRGARERAEALARAISDFARRDHTEHHNDGSASDAAVTAAEGPHGATKDSADVDSTETDVDSTETKD